MKRVLFVCLQNAGRSQMAQAFYERRGGEARSAGTRPADAVHEGVVESMREVGIDLAGRKPQRFDRSDAEWAELVVTMGCGDECPVVPGRKHVDWNLDDPADADVAVVRRIRDEIERRVAELD